jgi:nucleotide-binding universal stress UspA family protein
MSFRRILIAVDGEAVAAHAAEIGGELADELRAQLAFVHVMDPGPRGAEIGLRPDEQTASRQLEGRRLVGDFRRRLLPSGTVE